LHPGFFTIFFSTMEWIQMAKSPSCQLQRRELIIFSFFSEIFYPCTGERGNSPKCSSAHLERTFMMHLLSSHLEHNSKFVSRSLFLCCFSFESPPLPCVILSDKRRLLVFVYISPPRECLCKPYSRQGAGCVHVASKPHAVVLLALYPRPAVAISRLAFKYELH
jgi:hypothetical protein